MSYEPRGFMLVALGGQVFELQFTNREEMVELTAFVKERNGVSLAAYLGAIPHVEMIVQLAENLRDIKPMDVYKTDDVPVCAKHRVPMKASSKDPGGYYCNRKENDNSYCKNFVSSTGKVKNDK